MNILDMLGGGFSPDKIGEILSDSEKVKQFLPLLVNLADTYKLPDEHGISAICSFEDGSPILRVVATKIVETVIDDITVKQLVICRNIKNQSGEPIKFNLLSLIAANNEQKEEDK